MVSFKNKSVHTKRTAAQSSERRWEAKRVENVVRRRRHRHRPCWCWWRFFFTARETINLLKLPKITDREHDSSTKAYKKRGRTMYTYITDQSRV